MAAAGPKPDSPPSPTPRPRAQPEALVDRERRDPVLRAALHLGIPTLVSLAVHAVLLLALTLTTWHVLSVPAPREQFEAGIVASRGDPASGSIEFGNLPTLTDRLAEITPEAVAAPRAALAELASLSALTPGPTGDAVGLGESGRSGILGIGGGALGSTDSLGRSSEIGGGLGGAGVWNLKAAGRNFAYVVDFSGSVSVVADDLKRELKRSIGGLKPQQTFGVFTFFSYVDPGRDDAVTESFAPKLQPASADKKREFFLWIDRQAARGRSDPLPAIRRALSVRPDVVFLFSDGEFEDPKAEELIARENENSRTRIYCLVFDDVLLEDTSGLPKVTPGARRLQTIAEQSGGQCKIVTIKDLGRR